MVGPNAVLLVLFVSLLNLSLKLNNNIIQTFNATEKLIGR